MPISRPLSIGKRSSKDQAKINYDTPKIANAKLALLIKNLESDCQLGNKTDETLRDAELANLNSELKSLARRYRALAIKKGVIL